MISDGGQELVAYATNQMAITAYTADRIEAGRKPSAGYTNSQPLLLITPRGGPRNPNTPMRSRTYYVFSYAPDEATAAALDAVVATTLHGRVVAGGRFLHITEGQPGREPDTGWPYVMSIYRLKSL